MFISGSVFSFPGSPGARIDPEARPEVKGTGEFWVSGGDKALGSNNT